MPKIILEQKELIFLFLIAGILLMLGLGFGYFLGRYDQIQSQKGLIKTIPDVNCHQTVPGL